MASNQSSSEESETTFEVQTDRQSLEQYQFEPRRAGTGSDDTESSGSDSSSGGDSDREREDERIGNSGWCQWNHCSHVWLLRANEHRCCKENAKTRALAAPCNTDDSICIVNNADFHIVCLTPVVLRNVPVALNNVRADHWNVNPPDNKSLRYAAYRQFTWWVHGKLGPGRKRVIPACATHAIRSSFPKAEDEQYEGYHSGKESDHE